MKKRALILWVSSLFALLVQLRADEPSQVPPTQKVGTVYGKAVTAGDIGLIAPIDPAVKFDARDTARWELMGRVMKTFGSPVAQRFVKREKIEATAEEIEKFQSTSRKARERNVREWKALLVELEKELAAPNLSDEARANLQKKQTMYQRFIEGSRERASDVPDDLARMFIVAWKTERELHRLYGGRVIFQQAGPEALDARRRMFEQAEKDGDITFDDPGVRHLFYYYANMKHTEIDANSLKQSWFLDGESK